jgi:hypothetical protein
MQMSELFTKSLADRAMAAGFNVVDYPVYLPAINSQCSTAPITGIPDGRPFPAGLTPEDLAFWDEQNKLYDYPFVLYSIGQDNPMSQIDNAVTRSAKSGRFLLGDSGGYQIGSGNIKISGMSAKMNGDDAIEAWGNAYEIKNAIIQWLQYNCNYAMTLDLPLWALTKRGESSPFANCTVEQLIQGTVDNLHFIRDNMNTDTKWLNVIQGNTHADAVQWWNAVEDFRHGGWALAGNTGTKGGLFRVVQTILMMRDDGAFEAGQDWLHMLGNSTPKWSVMILKIQNELRQLNPKLTISFDSSSPFQDAGVHESVCAIPMLGSSLKSWSISKQKAPQLTKHVGSSEMLGWESPIGQHLQLGHLNVYEEAIRKRRYDTLSLAMLINHNVWVYLQTFQKAYDIATNSHNQLPQQLQECWKVVEEAFAADDWQAVLDANVEVLKAI